MTSPILPSAGQQPKSVEFSTDLSSTQNQSLDSLGTGWLSIDDYMGTVTTANIQLQATLQNIAITNPLLYKETYVDLAKSIIAYFTLAASISTEAAQITAFQQQLNTDINTYNNYMQLQLNTLNQAIIDYNQIYPSTNQSVQTLTNAYNAYNQGINTTPKGIISQGALNGEIANYNLAMEQNVSLINIMQASQGLPVTNPPPYENGSLVLAFPLSDIVTIPPAIQLPLHQSPVSGLATPVSVIPTPTQTQVLAYYLPSINATNATVQSVLAMVEQYVNFSVQQSELNPNNPTLPVAFIQKNPQVLFQSQGGSSVGSSVQLLSLSPGIGSAAMLRILNTASVNAVYLQATNELPNPHLLNQISTYTLELVRKIANVAATTTVQQQSDNPSSASNPGPAFDTLTGLSFAASTVSAINANTISDGVNQFVGSDPSLANLSVVEKQDTVKAFSTIIGLALLNVALAQVSQSLGTPGLPAQVLGNTNALSPSDIAGSAAASAVSINLEDPIQNVFLKLALTQQLQDSQGLSQEDAAVASNAIVNGALSALSKSTTPVTLDQFQQAIADATAAYGSGSLAGGAQATATAAAGFVSNEIANPYLNLPFAAGTFSSILPGGTSAAPGLAQSLTGTVVASNPELFTEGPTLEFVKRALKEASQRTASGTGGFSENLENTLVEQGVSGHTARQVSNKAVAFVNAHTAAGHSFDQAAQAAANGEAETPALSSQKAALLSQLQQELNSNAAIGLALNNTLAGNPSTIREFSLNFAINLIAGNIAPESAATVAHLAALAAAPYPTNPQTAPLLSTTPPTSVLSAADLTNAVITQIALNIAPRIGEVQAREIANQTGSTLTNSLINAYNNYFRIIKEELEQDLLSKYLAESVPAVVTPNTPVYSLTGQIGGISRSQADIVSTYMDPAARANLMNSNVPEEIVHDLQIRI